MNDTGPPLKKQTPKPTSDKNEQKAKPGDASSDQAQSDTPQTNKRRNRPLKTGLLLLVALILIVAAGVGAYWWRDHQARDEAASFEREIGELQERLNRLQTEAEDSEETDDEAGDEADETTSQDVTQTIESAVTSGDYTALEPHLADPVYVILAASEAYGDQTPTEAVNSLDYLDGAGGGWDFAPATSDLNAYRNGDYAQYFPVGAVVGISSDDYVVSFTFDSSGDIGGIFISPDAGLLTP